MKPELVNLIASTTQSARRLLEREFAEQLEGSFDLRPTGPLPEKAGSHLDARQALLRDKLYALVRHKMAAGKSQAQAVQEVCHAAAFTTLNRFAALKMLEARGLIQECVSKGDQSSGFKEFCGLAQSLAVQEGAYALYLGCLFDELAVEVKVLFDRQELSGLLWPRRPALLALLELLNAPALAPAWVEDETIGWTYQYFNSLDERREMRAASAAPRNSRELAVRNQFFTPRYVVKFLVDYTLGELFPKEPKDPRDLKVLDPACGSGHFLLYTFEVLLGIYRAAWEMEDLPPSSVSEKTLRQDFGTWEALEKAIPALILKHNLHGVDIDGRCAQIAALSLWMRAQKTYQAQGIAAGDRPLITKVNIAVAEPMPAEKDELQAFLDQHLSSDVEARMLGQLLKEVFEAMKLAGELGSLLKVEKAIAATLEAAEKQWRRGIQGVGPRSLFGNDAAVPQVRRLEFEVSGIDRSFWKEAEARLYTALQAFAEEATRRQGYQRQLFAEDAAHGFALIDLLRQSYDVVLMNPPFGECAAGAKAEFQRLYPRTKNDLYAAFVERGLDLLRTGGRLGAITSRTGFFLTSFKKWREEILLGEARPLIVADLGQGVLDAMVETAAYTLEKVG
ncbi:MAG: Eco57I restriction-modification methylase domain-containing protein [Candidatus Micrarchaeota archaeon]